MSRMARLIALILIVAALLLLALLAVPEVSGLAQRPAWRVELNRYLAFKAGPGSAPLTVIAASHATLPWEFGRDLSAGTFGDSVFFATDYRYTSEAGGSRPVPFPRPMSGACCWTRTRRPPAAQPVAWRLWRYTKTSIMPTGWYTREWQGPSHRSSPATWPVLAVPSLPIDRQEARRSSLRHGTSSMLSSQYAA